MLPLLLISNITYLECALMCVCIDASGIQLGMKCILDMLPILHLKTMSYDKEEHSRKSRKSYKQHYQRRRKSRKSYKQHYQWRRKRLMSYKRLLRLGYICEIYQTLFISNTKTRIHLRDLPNLLFNSIS